MIFLNLLNSFRFQNLFSEALSDINQNNFFKINNIKFIFGKILKENLKNGINSITLNNSYLVNVKKIFYIDCHYDYEKGYPQNRPTIESWNITEQKISLFIPDGPVNNIFYIIIALF